MPEKEKKLYVLLEKGGGNYGLLMEPSPYKEIKNAALCWKRNVPDLDLAIGVFDKHVHNTNDYEIIEKV